MCEMQTFMALIKKLETREYIKSLLACFGAPTIRGLKPGCLINLRRCGDVCVAATWRALGPELIRGFGVDAVTLSSRENDRDSSALILMYERELLRRALFTREALRILAPLGYGRCVPCVESCLGRLAERFEECFPHEVGIFLGYPPEDVDGFMRDGGKKPLASGYWKVYGDVGQARKTFRMFKRAERLAARSVIRRSLHAAA